MDKIKIAITGRVASVVALPEVVADNAEYEVDFALDPREGWDVSLPITALFVRRDGSYTPRIMDAGKTSCTMPPQTGTNIVFVGLTQDDMRTTTPATIKVHRSIRTVAHDPLPAPSEDVYAQILAAYAGIKILSGKGAPTSATQGAVNQLYRDEDTQRLYICTATDGGYTWAAVSGGGSVDVDVTLTKAGYAADAKAAGDAIRKKLDKTALPTAINDALAQAKASGEFDGAKGDKGDKGDPGAQGIRGEKGETGPAGPKGADGKDGAGMDVTGAKVGQIAKITAVDATGKPTGWGAVDMPSGGETWEKIADIALSAEIASYNVANFATWRKIKIIMQRGAFISGLSKNVWCRIRDDQHGNAEVYTCGFVTMEYGYVFWEFEAEVNNMIITSHKIATNNRVSAAGVMSTGTKLLGDISIDGLYMAVEFVDTSVIQAGDTITVLGIRR